MSSLWPDGCNLAPSCGPWATKLLPTTVCHYSARFCSCGAHTAIPRQYAHAPDPWAASTFDELCASRLPGLPGCIRSALLLWRMPMVQGCSLPIMCSQVRRLRRDGPVPRVRLWVPAPGSEVGGGADSVPRLSAITHRSSCGCCQHPHSAAAVSTTTKFKSLQICRRGGPADWW